MKFCMHCGAEISEGANFCKSCGAKVNSSETLGTFKAPDSEGEFVLTSWSEPSTDQPAEKKEKPQKKKEPKKAVKLKEKTKNRGCFGYILLFGKVLLIAVGSVFLLVFAIEYFSDDEPDSPKYEQRQYPTKTQPANTNTEDPIIPDGNKSGSTEDDGITRLEDMAPEDAVAYLEKILKSTKAELEEELNKGDDANPEKIEMLRFDMELYHKRLKKYQQQLQND